MKYLLTLALFAITLSLSAQSSVTDKIKATKTNTPTQTTATKTTTPTQALTTKVLVEYVLDVDSTNIATTVWMAARKVESVYVITAPDGKQTPISDGTKPKYFYVDNTKKSEELAIDHIVNERPCPYCK